MGSIISLLLFVGFFYLMMKYGCGAHARGGGCGHGRHRQSKADEQRHGENTATVKTMTRDPVCGMDIEISRAFHSVDYGPKTYYFCSNGCKAKFDANPSQYAK